MSLDNRRRKMIGLIGLLVFLIAFIGLFYFGYRQYFTSATRTVSSDSTALHIKLPQNDSLKSMNKLELYSLAEKDSLRKLEQASGDPYLKKGEALAPAVDFTARNFSLKPYKPETGLQDRMNKIYQSYNKAAEPSSPYSIPKPADTVPQSQPDPQMKQLENMLDKLIDIQYPELVKQRSKADTGNSSHVSLLLTNKASVRAVVHQTQTLTSGGTVKIRLLEDMQIGEVNIHKGNFLFGICTVSNERMLIQLNNVSFANQIYPIALTVYDRDGIEGIYVPGAIEREVSKEGADQAINSFNLNGYNSSIAGQAASAGIQTAKTLLSRKVKMVRVTLKAGHQVLLQNSHNY